jgi:hypothetical protein
MTDTRTEATNTTTAAGIATPSAEQFIDGLADLMAHSTRTPILRRPDEYGTEYEDVFFPAMDGVTLEGWFTAGDTRLLLECFVGVVSEGQREVRCRGDDARETDDGRDRGEDVHDLCSGRTRAHGVVGL